MRKRFLVSTLAAALCRELPGSLERAQYTHAVVLALGLALTVVSFHVLIVRSVRKSSYLPTAASKRKTPLLVLTRLRKE